MASDSRAGSENDRLIARCVALFSSADHAALTRLLPELEAVEPETEDQWRCTAGLFGKLGKTVWSRIMTDRFLVKHPDNVAARLFQISGLCQDSSRLSEAGSLIDAFPAAALTKSDDLITLAESCFICGRAAAGVRHLDAARDKAGADVATLIRIIHIYINVRELRHAKTAIRQLRERAGSDAMLLTSVIALSLRAGEQAYAAKLLHTAIGLADPQNQMTKIALIHFASQLQQFKLLPSLLASLDCRSITAIKQLELLLDAIEGRGYQRQEKAILERALELDPSDPRMAEARQRHKSQSSLFGATAGR